MAAFSLRPALAAGLSFLSLAAALADPKVSFRPDRADGIYAPGETVTWTVDVVGERSGDLSALTALPYVVKENGQVEMSRGTLDLSAGPAILTATCGEPATVLAEIRLDPKNPLPLGAGGAVFAPEKIGPSRPAPDDFDDFWKAKLAELDQVPLHPVLERVEGLPNSDNLEYDKVTLDNIRGTHVRGQLARPAREGRFPAMVMFQSAGVGPLDPQQVLAQARPGWLALNISAHDLPIDGSPEFYKDQSDHALNKYIYLGSEDRETCYFLRMFLGCVRAAEYLASRDDWDGRTLVVTGTSQGGLQSFAAAALYPKVSGLMVLVPAGCDSYAPLATPPRAFGWPYWISNWGGARDMKKVEQTAGYFDAINFAQRLRCPALIAVGLLDPAARPTGVIAAANAVRQPKELVILPLSDHYGTGGAQAPYFARFNAWKTAFQKGLPPPVPASAPVTAAATP